MSFLSLSPAALAPFRLFVRHGKYVRFGVQGALGVKGWQEGQPAPCLGHVPNSCVGILVTAACLFCSLPRKLQRAMLLCWVVGLGVAGVGLGAGGHGAGAQVCWERAAAFGLKPCSAGEMPAVWWLSINFQLNARRACFRLKKYYLNSILDGIEDLHVRFWTVLVTCE